MKPLMLGNGWFPDSAGGAERYFRALFEALRRRGSEPRAVVVAGHEVVQDEVVAAAAPHERLLTRIRRFRSAAERAGEHADLVDVHFALYGLLPIVLGRLRSKPLVVHFHGPWADESAAAGDTPFTAAAKRVVERAVYRRAAAAVTLSGAFKRILVERYRVAPWHVEVVPPGVDLERFTPGDRTEARRRLGIDSDVWLACSVRRLTPRMGVDVLLRAWGMLDRERLLVVAGEGPELPRLEHLSRELGIVDRVRFLGAIDEDELLAVYRAADVSVVPSSALEGFGLVVLESLACGTPVVVTAAGGLPEAVEGLEPRVTVLPGDPVALAERLAAPLPDRHACRAHAEHYTWDRTVDRHLGLYDRLVHGDRERNLRVVYVDHTAELSGAEIALLRLLPALEGVEPHVVLAEDGPLVGRLIAAGVSVEVLPLARRAAKLRRTDVGATMLVSRESVQTLAYAFRLALRLRRLRPDVIHTNSLKAAYYGGLAARIARIPMVSHVHDRLADDYLPGRAAQLTRRVLRAFPRAVVVSSHTVGATLGRPAEVIPNAVLPPRSKGPIRFAHPLTIGMIGRIAPWKGQHVFIDAFAQAFPEGDERASVVGAPVFGSDEERYLDELHERAAAHGLNGRLRFEGFADDVEAVLAGLDVLVHASVIPEPFGLVVLEGMAAGVPVIATDAGGPAEIVTHGVDGLLYPPGDSEALAQTLRLLASDPGLRLRLADGARRRAAEFAPEAVADRMCALYDQVMDGARGHASGAGVSG